MLFPKLRRRVAVAICPELGVETRKIAEARERRGMEEVNAPFGKFDVFVGAAGPAPGIRALDVEGILGRGVTAPYVFAELGAVIADLRRENARLGGSDRELGLRLCGQVGFLAASLPVRGPSSK